MKILLLFHCTQCNRQFEEFCDSNTKTMKCLCGNMADKIFGRTHIDFACGGSKTGFVKPSTPVESDIDSPVIRFPHYADKNTGRDLGFGQPEINREVKV